MCFSLDVLILYLKHGRQLSKCVTDVQRSPVISPSVQLNSNQQKNQRIQRMKNRTEHSWSSGPLKDWCDSIEEITAWPQERARNPLSVNPLHLCSTNTETCRNGFSSCLGDHDVINVLAKYNAIKHIITKHVHSSASLWIACKVKQK